MTFGPMGEAEFWGDTRACAECGSRFVGMVTKVYCTRKCKDAVLSRRRCEDPEKRAADSARRRAAREAAPVYRKFREARKLSKVERKARDKQVETNYILDDWVWIGPYVGWSAEAAAPRIGVGYDRFLKILREAREAGDPRGVIPETVGGVRLYHAA